MGKGICDICGSKKGFLNKMVEVSDGEVCQNCWVSNRLKMDKTSLSNAKKYSVVDLEKPFKLRVSHNNMINQFKPTQSFMNIDFDDNLRMFKVDSLLFKYDEIVDFEFRENGAITVSKGGIGKALIGGAIAGGVGAIVGASMGSRKTVTKVQSMDILIRLKDSYTGAVVVKILNSPIKSNSMFYDTFINAAKDILSKLTQITMDKPTVQISEADD